MMRRPDPHVLMIGRAGGGQVDRRIATAIGFCLLFPGLSVITVGDIGIQPVIPLLVCYVSLFPVLGLSVPIQPLLWAAIGLISFAATIPSAESPHIAIVYSALQGGYLVIGAVSFGAVLSTARQREGFVRGYVAAALLSSVVALFQMLFSLATGSVIILANNVNFAIVGAEGRGAAFTPEPSSLAALLIPALLCIWFEHQSPIGLLRRWQRGWPAVLILILGLIATKSTSLLYVPFLFILVMAFHSRSIRDFARRSATFIVAAAIAALIFLPLYSTRLSDNDARASQEWRVIKIEAGFRIFSDYPLTGAGIGSVSDQSFFEPYMDIPPDLVWSTDPRKGVDSTPVRILAESGLLGFAFAYYPLFLFGCQARALFRRPAFGAIGSLSLGLLFSEFVISGYRDQIAFLLPMVAFAFAASLRVTPRATRQRLSPIKLYPRPGFSHGSML